MIDAIDKLVRVVDRDVVVFDGSTDICVKDSVVVSCPLKEIEDSVVCTFGGLGEDDIKGGDEVGRVYW